MHTLKRFIQYYAPYKAVFFLDLVCAAIISLVDLAFPQILRTLTRTLFVENASSIMRNQMCIRDSMYGRICFFGPKGNS